MHAASAAQRRAFARGELPPVESVLPEGEVGILAVPQAMPGLRLPYSLSYLVHSQGEAHLIDTGMGNEQNWELLSDALASAGLRVTDIASVTLTHVHRDHAGLAARVRSVSGATVRMHEADARAVRAQTPRIDPDEFDAALDRWGVPGATQDELRTQVRDLSRPEESIPIDEEVRDGAELQLGEVRVRALHTPGHTAGHLSVVADDLDLVFTGDHILPAMSSGVGLGGLSDRFDPLSDYLASVRRIQVLGALQVCPGHGYRFFGADARCAEILAHHARRGQAVAELIARHPSSTAWELASALWRDRGWDDMDAGTRFSALAQTEMHARLVR